MNAKLRTLENAVLDAMLADEKVRGEFSGCLAPLAAAPARGCGSCGGRARKAREAYDAAKSCLARMDDTGRRRLKEALHCDQVRIVAAEDGVAVTYQF